MDVGHWMYSHAVVVLDVYPIVLPILTTELNEEIRYVPPHVAANRGSSETVILTTQKCLRAIELSDNLQEFDAMAHVVGRRFDANVMGKTKQHKTPDTYNF